ncbi:hypothetical protein RIF29_20667 [Crotalaria pallida]|uniref:Uncharacterized protein n=1 Tax=Crotalaria pallida TaxID=3830 RepID=A0AAN9I8W5_CROPI
MIDKESECNSCYFCLVSLYLCPTTIKHNSINNLRHWLCFTRSSHMLFLHSLSRYLYFLFQFISILFFT